MAKRHLDMVAASEFVESSSDLSHSPPQLKRPRFSINDLLLQTKQDRQQSESPKVSPIGQPDDDEEEEDSRRASTPVSSTTNGDITDDCVSQTVPNWAPAGQSPLLSDVECHLEGRELWARFYKLSTEMIITKSGRRMFPTVKIRLEGCDPDANYYVFLDVVPVDSRRYRYVYNKSSWLTAGKAETAPRSRIYMHPDSPFTGRQLATQVISFEKAKLTNNDVDRVGHLVLNSMHKYQPRVHIVRRERQQKPLDGNSTTFDLLAEQYKTFQFTETQFMAVTAYQNQLITKLKIEKNPFAKGFRDPTGRNGDLCDISRHFMENLPMRPPFDPTQLLLQQCWPPPPSLLDSTNLPKFFGFPFQLPAVTIPSQNERLNANEEQKEEEESNESEVLDRNVRKTPCDDTPSSNNDLPRLSPAPASNLLKSTSNFSMPPMPPFFPLAAMHAAHTSGSQLLAAMGLLDPQQMVSLLHGMTDSTRTSSAKRCETKIDKND